MKLKTGLQSGSSGKLMACVDFDNVLMIPDSPWLGASVAKGAPVPGAKQFMNEVTKNYRVGIFSSRNFEPGGIAAMKGWLQSQADRQLIRFNFETVCQLPGRQQKKGMQGISGIILLFQNVSSSYGEPVRSAGTIF